jgi:hypothetical protein
LLALLAEHQVDDRAGPLDLVRLGAVHLSHEAEDEREDVRVDDRVALAARLDVVGGDGVGRMVVLREVAGGRTLVRRGTSKD